MSLWQSIGAVVVLITLSGVARRGGEVGSQVPHSSRPAHGKGLFRARFQALRQESSSN